MKQRVASEWNGCIGPNPKSDFRNPKATTDPVAAERMNTDLKTSKSKA